MKSIHTVLLLFFLTQQISITASTIVPAGNVSGTWTAAGSPYMIQGEIKVTANSMLTIEPGVTVEFAGHHKFIIEGRLVANGNSSSHITYTAQVPATGWYGLRFQNMNVNPMDTSYLSYCDLYYGLANGTSPDNYGGGIYCENSSRIKLNNCLISQCTATQGAGMYCNSSSPVVLNTTFYLGNDDGLCLNTSSSPKISGCTFLENNVYGLRINSNTCIPVVTGCLFKQTTGYPVYAFPDQVGGFSGNTYQDNTNQLFYVNPGNISRDAVWVDPGIPYKIAGDMTVQGTYGSNGVTTLTLQAGVEMRFSSAAGLAISSTTQSTAKGGLIANGAEADSIVFTGETATPGYWDGIAIYDYAVDSVCKMNYCVVSYGGYSTLDNLSLNNCSPTFRHSYFRYGDGNGVYLYYCTSPSFKYCKIKNNTGNGIYNYSSGSIIKRSTISNNSSYGIYSLFGNPVIDSCMIKSNGSYGFYDLGGTDYPIVTNDTFNLNLSYPVNIHCNAVNGLSANIYTGNTTQRIRVGGGTITLDATWSDAGIPYEISGDVNISGNSGPDNITTLNLQPGVNLKFAAQTGLSVGSASTTGGLMVLGTSASPVVCTANAITPAPGYWDGISFNSASQDNLCHLYYLILEYAGYSSLDGITLSGASPLIENCRIHLNDGAGIGCLSTSNPLIRNSIFRDNTTYGVYVSGSSPAISNNTIDNQPYGLYCTGASDPQVFNNIFYGNTKGINSTPALSVVTYNDFYSNGTNFEGTVPTGFGVLSYTNFNGTQCDVYKNIFQLPGFVNVTEHDFSLTLNSACINAGNPITDTTANHFCQSGNPRFLEEYIDIGAAEGGIWWTGAVSNNWHTPGNWSIGSVPLQSQSVTIAPFCPQYPRLIDNNAIVKKLFLYGGAVVNVQAGLQLQVLGNQ